MKTFKDLTFEPHPCAIALFILLCPAVNTIYAICRSKGFFRTTKEFLFDGIKDTWKKL